MSQWCGVEVGVAPFLTECSQAGMVLQESDRYESVIDVDYALENSAHPLVLAVAEYEKKVFAWSPSLCLMVSADWLVDLSAKVGGDAVLCASESASACAFLIVASRGRLRRLYLDLCDGRLERGDPICPNESALLAEYCGDSALRVLKAAGFDFRALPDDLPFTLYSVTMKEMWMPLGPLDTAIRDFYRNLR